VKSETESAATPFELMAFAFTLAAGTAAVCTVLVAGRPPAAPLWYAAGGYACFLLGRIDAAGPPPAPDYLHTGSAAFLSLGAIIIARFFASPVIILCLVPVLAVLFELYTQRFLSLGRRDTALAGIALNGIFAVLALFMLRADPRFDTAALSALFSGLAGVSAGTIGAPLAVIPVLVALHVLARRAAPELALLSHGRSYFEGAGLDYERGRVALQCARGILSSITMLSAGWLGGSVLIGPAPRGAKVGLARDLSTLTQYLCFSQLLLFASSLVGSLAITPLWFIATGAYFYYKNRWRILPHA